jgi:hypothetical protein
MLVLSQLRNPDVVAASTPNLITIAIAAAQGVRRAQVVAIANGG